MDNDWLCVCGHFVSMHEDCVGECYGEFQKLCPCMFPQQPRFSACDTKINAVADKVFTKHQGLMGKLAWSETQDVGDLAGDPTVELSDREFKEEVLDILSFMAQMLTVDNGMNQPVGLTSEDHVDIQNRIRRMHILLRR